MVQSRQTESHDQAAHRLAAVAAERGIQIHWYDRGAIREYYATSASTPGLLHRVTMATCSCDGFIRHGRCSHHARLLDELDELPPLPEPPTPAAMAERRAERVSDWRSNVQAHADAWLASLIKRQDRGEVVPAGELQEAVAAVALYADASHQPIALAA